MQENATRRLAEERRRKREDSQQQKPVLKHTDKTKDSRFEPKVSLVDQLLSEVKNGDVRRKMARSSTSYRNTPTVQLEQTMRELAKPQLGHVTGIHAVCVCVRVCLRTCACANRKDQCSTLH